MSSQGLNIYIAAFFDTRERLFSIVKRLEGMGHKITSSWLTESKAVTYHNVTDSYRLACALRDRHDIRQADILVIDTIDVSPRGGREWEGGIASTEGLPFIVVGPYRNVFHQQALKHFDDWEECLLFFQEARVAL